MIKKISLLLCCVLASFSCALASIDDSTSSDSTVANSSDTTTASTDGSSSSGEVTAPEPTTPAGEPAPALKDWSVLIYLSPNGWGNFAIKQIDEAVSGICDETTNVLVCCRLTNKYASLWQLTHDGMVQCDPIKEVESDADRLTRLMQMLIEQYPAQKYALILNGDSTGLVDFVYDGEQKKWVESEFTGQTRGVLLNDKLGTQLTTTELLDVMNMVSQIRGGKLDLLVADTSFMGGLELAAAFGDSVAIYLAAQSHQYLAGFSYETLFGTLAQTGVSAARLGAAVATASATQFNDGGSYPKFKSFSVTDCAAAQSLLNDFISFINDLNLTLALDDRLAAEVYATSLSLKRELRNNYYVDFVAWLTQVRAILVSYAAVFHTDLAERIASIDGLIAGMSTVVLTNAAVDGVAMCGLSLCCPKKIGSFPLDLWNPWHQFIQTSIDTASCEECV
ncbi:MAG: hypothetical protein QG604_439 [Candidatus Dependentiae bacterium]|nr:hypothetical protein [Candidatus Dependentiae bacterium]